MSNSTLEISDYMAVLHRRKYHLLIPTIVVLLIAIGVAFGLPPVYRSTATILIEQQDIPRDMVRTTVTTFATERIQVISQRVLTRENLWSIIEKFDLFRDKLDREDRSEIITRVRDGIGIRMISADVTDPTSGRSGIATIAFELSYDSHDPLAARNVADELSSLFLRENIRIRAQMAAETSGFLAEEANKLSIRLAELEAELATFKEKNVGQMPELMQMNMSLMERTERELEDTQRAIGEQQERELFLETQLAQLEPNTGESPAGRIRALQVRYLTASALYAPDHPDVVGLRREIESLRARIGDTENSRQIEEQILKSRAELTAAHERYSENHPDILRLQRSILALEDELQKARANSFVSGEYEADNPAYISTRTQLEAAKIRLKSLTDLRERLREKLALYEHRITQMPGVEQESFVLRREYDNTVQKFHEIKQKQLEAQLGEKLETEQRGERFSLIEAPYIPSQPSEPNRLGILLLGFVLSLTSGIGFAAGAEYLDRSIRGSRGVAALAGAPPLVMIPYIRTEEDVRLFQRRVMLVGVSVLVMLVLGLLTVQVVMTH